MTAIRELMRRENRAPTGRMYQPPVSNLSRAAPVRDVES
jgi:hypothetical protein